MHRKSVVLRVFLTFCLQIENFKNTFVIKKGNKIVFNGEIRKKLLEANLRIPQKELYTCITHRRYGHKGSDENCESCKFGKMTRNKFLKNRIFLG